MPHPCKNYEWCNKMAGNSAILCPDCEKEQEQLEHGKHTHDPRAVGWTRYSNNRDAKPGHKHGKDETR